MRTSSWQPRGDRCFPYYKNILARSCASRGMQTPAAAGRGRSDPTRGDCRPIMERKMMGNDTVSGFLDVKISARSRRGFTPWKAWQKQWCEIRRLDSIENGVELKFKSSSDGTVLSTAILPRSSTLCRTESRTKQYAFGIFTLGRNQKPLLFLSGISESDSQMWMSSIRKMLCVASYLPVGDLNFHVSVVDNEHSRAAGLTGVHGVLGSNSQDIILSDPCTGEVRITWKWYQFHQFHLQAPSHQSDENMICVMHTSGDFPVGAGQIYLYCAQAPKLLNHLVTRGKPPKPSPGLLSSRRLSRSEGDLCDGSHSKDSQHGPPDSPECFRSNSGSDDSGVRVSMTSDDLVLRGRMGTSLITLGVSLLSKTPGGSETNEDSLQDLSALNEQSQTRLPRRESGVSLSSGIYEEISETPTACTNQTLQQQFAHHVYENPEEVLLKLVHSKCVPPPLPPRQFEGIVASMNCENGVSSRLSTPYKHRCNTLPAKDLSRISQIFTSDSEYMVMTPSKTTKLIDKLKIANLENLYMPMSPITNIKNKLENCYMVMSGKKC